MFNKRCIDKTMEMDMAKPYEMDYKMGMMNYGYGMPMQLEGVTCPVVMEAPIERVCHREICHHVPHVCPINTRVINHHIYRHTYQPMYTCTTEDTVSNVYDNKCGF